MFDHLSIIIAIAANQVIGHQNQLPWHLPADLKHFKQLTLGKSIIMGRKTFESIGKPLPGRQNIVVSRKWSAKQQDFIGVNSLSEAIALTDSSKEAFIIGGQQLIEQALPLVAKIYLTRIHHSFVGDTYFPELNMDDWQIVSEENHSADLQNPYPYSFFILERSLKR